MRSPIVSSQPTASPASIRRSASLPPGSRHRCNLRGSGRCTGGEAHLPRIARIQWPLSAATIRSSIEGVSPGPIATSPRRGMLTTTSSMSSLQGTVVVLGDHLVHLAAHECREQPAEETRRELGHGGGTAERPRAFGRWDRAAQKRGELGVGGDRAGGRRTRRDGIGRLDVDGHPLVDLDARGPDEDLVSTAVPPPSASRRCPTPRTAAAPARSRPARCSRPRAARRANPASSLAGRGRTDSTARR